MRRNSLGKEFAPLKSISGADRSAVRRDSLPCNAAATPVESAKEAVVNPPDEAEASVVDFVSEEEVWENQSWKTVRSIGARVHLII